MANRRAAGGRAWVAWLIVLVVVLGGAGIAVYRARHPAKAGQAAKAKQLWTCPMHPQIVREEPGQCPICGMELVPLEEPKQKPTAAPASGEPGKAVLEIPGYGTVSIDPNRQQLIGVVTTAARRRAMERLVRTVGVVTPDESRLSDVHTKVEGWVEKLYANETGKLVREGQPLLTIYSPDLVSTQRDYLVALRSRDRLAQSPLPEVRRSGETMVEAARERLKLWDISDREVQRLEQTGEVRKALTLYAPASGYIMEKTVVEGMRVMPEMTLYRLADLSRVWVEADIYEYEAPLVEVGQKASLTLQARPGKTYSGRLTYVYPNVEAATRTLKARLEFSNPGLGLKPGMYAEVTISAAAEAELAVPELALLDTGTRKLVFVQEDEATFRPREVTVGPRGEGYYPVLSGLREGEKVVSSPNFLFDSESQLRAAMQQMSGSGQAGHQH